MLWFTINLWWLFYGWSSRFLPMFTHKAKEKTRKKQKVRNKNLLIEHCHVFCAKIFTKEIFKAHLIEYFFAYPAKSVNDSITLAETHQWRPQWPSKKNISNISSFIYWQNKSLKHWSRKRANRYKKIALEKEVKGR